MTKNNTQLGDFLRKLTKHLGNTDYHELMGIVGAEQLEGNRQEDEDFGHIFVKQWTGMCGDDYSGFIFFPVSETEYLKVSYSC